MRFTNWLQNGQGSGSTESGVYTIGNGVSEIRDPGATYFLPSWDEWYKAAYHKNDGVTGNYWDYPTSTDAVPFSDQPPGNDAPTQSNTANFFYDDGIDNGYNDGYAVTGSPSGSSTQNYLTDVGAYTASLSPYGTLDQAGNVWEWNEEVHPNPAVPFRGVWGGGGSGIFFVGEFGLVASDAFHIETNAESGLFGFRVARRIPEPSTLLLGAIAGLGMLCRNARRHATSGGLFEL